MLEAAAAADPIKLSKSCRIAGVRRAYESGCQAGGRDNYIYQAEKSRCWAAFSFNGKRLPIRRPYFAGSRSVYRERCSTDE
jgi:hypothetical protein